MGSGGAGGAGLTGAGQSDFEHESSVAHRIGMGIGIVFDKFEGTEDGIEFEKECSKGCRFVVSFASYVLI